MFTIGVDMSDFVFVSHHLRCNILCIVCTCFYIFKDSFVVVGECSLILISVTITNSNGSLGNLEKNSRISGFSFANFVSSVYVCSCRVQFVPVNDKRQHKVYISQHFNKGG